jgi:hypothetical protein
MNEKMKNRQQEPLRILVVAASARTGSLNAKLARLTAQVIVKRGGIADYKSIAEFDCPSFSSTVQ